MSEKLKTEGELTFEKYLTDNGIGFVCEPGIGTKTPDYLLDFTPPILVEVKDLGIDELEKNVLQQLEINHRASWDTGQIHDHVRRRLKKAQEQLVEYKGKYHCLAVIYKPQSHLTRELDFYTVTGAMYGNIQIVMSSNSSDVLQQFDTTTSFLRHNKNTTISAVAIIEKIRPNKPLLSQEFERIHSEDGGRDKSAEAIFSEIRAAYPNVDFDLHTERLIIIHNIHANLPLPTGLFTGRYDQEYKINERTGKFESFGSTETFE